MNVTLKMEDVHLKYDTCSFMYGETNKETKTSKIRYKIVSFHEILFNTVKITFSKRKNIFNGLVESYECVGFVEIRNAEIFCEAKKNFKIFDGRYSKLYQCYETSKKKVVGNLTILINIHNKEVLNYETLEDDQNCENFTSYTQKIIKKSANIDFSSFHDNKKNSFFNNMFVSLFVEQKTAKTYSSHFYTLWRIYSILAKGSLYCHWQFWLGLYQLEKHYKSPAKKFNNHKSLNDLTLLPDISANADIKSGAVFSSGQNAIKRDFTLSENNIAGFGENDLYFTDLQCQYSHQFENNLAHYVKKSQKFYAYYLNKFYYAISNYGHFPLLALVKKRRTISKKMHNSRKTVLEYLDIKEENLFKINLKLKKYTNSTYHVL